MERAHHSTLSRRQQVALVLLGLVTSFATTGLFSPAYAAPPANDDFASARVIAGSSGSTAANVTGATLEPGEPEHFSVWDEPEATTHSVWFRWTAPVTGRVEFSTSASVVDLYTGSALASLQDDAYVCDNSSAGWSDNCKKNNVVAGTVYRIAVTGYEGTYELRWRMFTRPANDDFAAATVLSGLDPVIPDIDDGGDFATAQAGEPQHRAGTPASHSVWYRWRATWTADVTVGVTVGFDGHDQCFFAPTDVVAYTGSSLTGLTRVARVNTTREDGFLCESAVLRFRARAGTTYSIAIDSVDPVSPLFNGRLHAAPLCTVTGTVGKDTLTGTAGNDVLCGGEGDDSLKGQGGDDLFVGGAGVDAASYADATTGVIANLTTSTATGQGTDTFREVENLVGSAFTDKLDGDAGTNTLNGGGGNDGLWGQAGNDTLLGADGDDTLGGGLGNDRLNGGAGTDTTHYGKAAAVTVDLRAGSSTGEGTDALSLLESVTGSPGADRLTGTDGSNVLRGGGGNDALLGQGGNDSLLGAGGNDALTGGAGTDRCDGGTGTDTGATCETTVAIP